MPVQTTYGFYSAGLIAGQLADNGHREVNSVIAEAAIAAGIVGIRGGTTRTEVRPPTSPDAADVDGIATAAVVISAATAQTIAAASFDGVVGAGEMFPPRNVTLTLSNSADWDATTAVITGTDQDGAVISENFLIPNGGGATVDGALYFASVTSVLIPAQTGTGGFFQVGVRASVTADGTTVVAWMYLDAELDPWARDPVPNNDWGAQALARRLEVSHARSHAG